MNKMFKTIPVLAVVMFATGVFAAPPGKRAPHHGHDKGSDGVRLATDIVRLVGASLDIVAPRKTVVVAPPAQPVVVQPAVVAPPPPPAPVVIAPPPPPAPIVIAPPPAPRYHHHHPAPPHRGHGGFRR